MNKMMWKTTLREIKQSLGRYLAILAIVALGVGLFAGLKIMKPLIIETADQYLQDKHFYDFQLVSTYGFEQEDVEYLASREAVHSVQGSYTYDVLYQYADEENTMVMKVHTLTEGINELNVAAGRIPKKAGECIVDSDAYGEESIGKTIRLTDMNEEDTLDSFAVTEFTITGVADASNYIQYERGNTSLGTGKVHAFMYVHPASFDSEVYTEVWVKFEEEFVLYSDEYEAFIKEKEVLWEEYTDASSKQRFDRIQAEAYEELADARKEFETEKADASAELEDAKQKLEDAEAEIEDGKQQIADGKAQLAEGKKELQNGKQEIKDGWAELADNEKTLTEGAAQIEKNLALMQEKEAELSDGIAVWERNKELVALNKIQLEAGLQELTAKEEQLLAGEAALTQGKLQLEEEEEKLIAAKNELEEQETALLLGEAQLNMSEEQLLLGEEQLKEQEAVLEAKELELEQLSQMLENGLFPEEERPQMEQLLALGRSEVEAGKARLSAEKEKIKVGKEQIAKSRVEIEAGKAQLEAGRTQLAAGELELALAKQELAYQESLLADARTQLADGKLQLDAGMTQILAAQTELENSWKQLEDGKKQLEAGKSELASAKQEILDGKKQLEDGKRKLAEAEREMLLGEQELIDAEEALIEAKAKLADGEREYLDGLAEYEDGLATFETEIADAEIELADAETEIKDMELPECYLLGRDTNVGYVCLDNDSSIVDNVSDVFPVFFFLIAALVCMTTMNRMIEEQRTQIGILKALGYSKGTIMAKYLFYSGSAAGLGCLFGYFVGTFLLTKIIWMAYGMMYNIDSLVYFIDWPLAIVSMVCSMACSMGVTWFSCHVELNEVAASLMRPKAPKAGKRVFLEYVPFIWKRLSFLVKVSIRNVFRYKKRFFMMVVGISGSMALLVTGFGIQDSISDVVTMQYEEIQKYHMSASFKDPLGIEVQKELEEVIKGRVTEFSLFMEGALDLKYNGNTKSVSMIVPKQPKSFENYIDLHTLDGEAIPYPEEGEVVISHKICKDYGIGIGDSISLMDEEHAQFEVKVSGICQNFVSNYVFLHPDTCNKLWKEAEYKTIYINVPVIDESIHLLSADLMAMEEVVNVVVNEDVKERFETMMSTMDYLVVVIIFCAAALAFIVLYNLTNINITERIREIATIKVLGFYKNETASYVFRENIALTAVGSAAGLFLGKLFHAFVMSCVKVDMIAFDVRIKTVSYLYSVLLTLLFAWLVNKFMSGKLEKISMTESLKSVD